MKKESGLGNVDAWVSSGPKEHVSQKNKVPTEKPLRTTLVIDRDLHLKLVVAAKQQQVSVNNLILDLLSEKYGNA